MSLSVEEVMLFKEMVSSNLDTEARSCYDGTSVITEHGTRAKGLRLCRTRTLSGFLQGAAAHEGGSGTSPGARSVGCNTDTNGVKHIPVNLSGMLTCG